MRNVLIAAAALVALAASPAISEPIAFPAPSNIRIDNAQTWENDRPKWSEIPDFGFDCENGDSITVSHQRGRVTFEKSGSEYKIDGSNASYQNVPDRFGNQQIVGAVGLIEGGPSTHPTWMLSGEYGSTWYFSKRGKSLKCLPR
jgi:hypothetical protein